MIWIILAIIINIILVIIAFREYDYLLLILIVPILIMGLLMNMLCGVVLHNVCETESVVSDTQEIVALKDSYDQMSGRYFLGSGNINSQSYYYYMTNEDRGLKVQKVNTDNAFLKLDKNPHIETIKYKFKNPFVKLFAYDITTDYIIYCPEGTIDYNYKVDLE